MSYPSRGTDLAKSVQSFAGRRPWPGDHLHRNPRSYDAPPPLDTPFRSSPKTAGDSCIP